LGTNANKQGRVAGSNVAGREEHFRGVLGSQAIKVFGTYAAVTGLNLRQARDAGFDAAESSIVKADRASYYPGGEDNYLNLVFERKSGRLLGAQGIGSFSVAGRINTLVAAITAGMTVEDIHSLDLLYTPAIAPVYDPLLIAADSAVKKVE
jgi:NADPH-dependent 2,4-dienoyl-CoA reductase/sulfur reductase-like enzyme